MAAVCMEVAFAVPGDAEAVVFSNGGVEAKHGVFRWWL